KKPYLGKKKSIYFSFLRQGFTPSPAVALYVDQDGLQLTGILLPQPPASPPHTDTTDTCYYMQLSVGLGDLNAEHHPYTASALPTEQSCQLCSMHFQVP
ncbi:hypothetical protein ACQP3F_26425, partial [Escherichia coli]